ncbi:hydroxyproline-rich glycoprotein family protein [Trema orientale]|uniref:Hydroxyproline-rich glycoprotein family protein n=1 Tax=Trema orientale TaxID=63057 RepID=A0A2P5BEQ0_TREOI|nr:hydroxyproline-rich glycoprotein family protein [Trema orientale]
MIPTTYNPSYESPPPSNNSQRSYHILSRLIFVLVVLFIIINVSISFTWLVLNPQLPLVTISNFTLSADHHNHPNDDQTIQFTVQNPNKKIKLYFDSYEVSLFCGRMVLLSRTSSEKGSSAFLEVEKKSQKDLIVKLRSNSTERRRCGFSNYWDKKAFGDKYNKSYKKPMRNEITRFKVKMVNGVKFSALNDWPSKRRMIEVLCKLEVFSSADGKEKLEIHRGHEHCLVNTFPKIIN